MRGTWKKQLLLTTSCLECDAIIRVYQTKKGTARRRVRLSVNAHCLRRHPGMGQRERSRLADRVAEAEGY